MRPIITHAVDAMQTPSQADRATAADQGGRADVNNQLQAEWPCLTTFEIKQPDAPLPAPTGLTIAAWNIERCKRVEHSAELIRATGADIVLATEVDYGMARSGQRHATRDLAALLGMGYAYGVEFVELGTGDPVETKYFAGAPNDHGLHGNALLSRFPLKNPALIPLDAGGLWFVTQPKNDGQLRVGGRMAMAAQIDTAQGPLTISAAHYESESTPASRADQTQVWLRALSDLYGDGPLVIGGDLNTNALADGTRTLAKILENPAVAEPAFTHFAAAGLEWRNSMRAQVTTRTPPERLARDQLQMLDWIMTRGVSAFGPQIWPALSTTGQYLSDHELLTTRISL